MYLGALKRVEIGLIHTDVAAFSLAYSCSDIYLIRYPDTKYIWTVELSGIYMRVAFIRGECHIT